MARKISCLMSLIVATLLVASCIGPADVEHSRRQIASCEGHGGFAKTQVLGWQKPGTNELSYFDHFLECQLPCVKIGPEAK